MAKRVRVHDMLEIGEDVHTSLCAAKRCKTRLVWEASEGGTIHDGSEYWLEDCKCHEEDKKRYCSRCRETEVCENCHESDSSE